MDKNVFCRRVVTFAAAVHQVAADITKGLPPIGVTPTQYDMLRFVALRQPVTLSQLSDCLHISMPNTSREMKKLYEKGLCEKTEAAGDRRKQLIRLSTRGAAVMGESFEQLQARIAERLQGVTDAELEELMRAMDALERKVFAEDRARDE